MLLGGLLVAVLFCSLRCREGYPDDALITLRYAQNLLAGNGWIYNLGEAVNATTSPLHVMVVTAIGACLGGDLLSALPLAFALPLLASVAMVWSLLRPSGRIPAVIGGMLMATTPRLYTTMGMESTLLFACALAACMQSARGRHRAAGLLGGVAVLARPDAGLLVLLLAWRALRTGRRHGLGLLLGAGAVVLPWSVFAACRFGSPLPNTLAIKLAQRHLFKDPPIFLHGAWHEVWLADEHGLGLGPKVLVCLFALAVGLLAWRAREHVAEALLVAFAGLHFACYAWFDLPPYHWYYALALGAATLAVAAGFGMAWRTQRPVPTLAAVVLSTWLIAAAMPDLLAPRPTRENYRQAGQWLARNTPSDCSIAAADIGILGFHAWPRTIVDMQGLATPGGAGAIAGGDTGWWFPKHRPDYVVVHDPAWATFERPAMAQEQFRTGYRRIEGVGIPGIAVFTCVGAPRGAAPR